eukprot:9484448-Pyramimonas_sp.AAC.3
MSEMQSQQHAQPPPSQQQQHVFTRQHKPPRCSVPSAGGGCQSATMTSMMQATKPAAITEASSMQLTRNLLRIA